MPIPCTCTSWTSNSIKRGDSTRMDIREIGPISTEVIRPTILPSRRCLSLTISRTTLRRYWLTQCREFGVILCWWTLARHQCFEFGSSTTQGSHSFKAWKRVDTWSTATFWNMRIMRWCATSEWSEQWYHTKDQLQLTWRNHCEHDQPNIFSFKMLYLLSMLPYYSAILSHFTLASRSPNLIKHHPLLCEIWCLSPMVSPSILWVTMLNFNPKFNECFDCK